MAERFSIGRHRNETEAEQQLGLSSDDSRASYDTARRDSKRYLSYTARITLTMTIVVLVTVLLFFAVLFGLSYFEAEPVPEEEQMIRNELFAAMFFAAIVAVFVAVLVGGIVARSLAKPVNRITLTARQLRNGDMTARSGVRGDDEIGKLGETFDDMATKLEKDMQLEHRLTSDVAHELRTPLMAMQATVEAMQDGVLPCDEEHLGTVADEVRRLSRLVDAMLRLSRIENGTTPFEPKRTEMVSLVQSIYDSQHQLFHDVGLRLRYRIDVPHEEVFAEVDRDMVRQAIVNLLSNALRYSHEGGYVIVQIAQDRTDVIISVKDSGIGIAKEDLSRVFSRFWRSEASRERAAGGLGVGLAVTKEIVDKHKGYISVESELGKGTEFALHLPRVRFNLSDADE